MKKIILCCILLLLSSFVSAQDAEIVLEGFKPLPKNIEKITAIDYSIYEGDTTSEKIAEYNFDKNGNLISWDYFPYYVKEEIKYDSLNRVIQTDALYGESFGNGITTYYYPSSTQKIEIQDKMGYYHYKKSDFIFDSVGRVVEEIKYDSTFNKMEEQDSVYKLRITYSYDENNNLINQLEVAYSNEKLIYSYKMLRIYDKENYDKEKLMNQNIHSYKENATKDFYTDEVKEFFYIKKGDFEGRIEKDTELITSQSDTIQLETYYTYQKIDSMISQERKYFNNKDLMQHHKYFYKNNQLIKKEEYTIPKDKNQEPKLSICTEYSYLFYK